MDSPFRPARFASLLAVALALGLLLPQGAEAQERTFTACYVPGAGAVYLIGEEGLPPECMDGSHVRFSWSEGGEGVTEHGELEGLEEDDHPGYVREGEGAGGDLGGDYPAPSVTGLQGHAVSGGAPSEGQVLGWDGSSWAPVTPPSGVTEHGNLEGLGEDDHELYLRADGARSLSGPLDANGNKVVGLAEAGSEGEAVPYEQAVKAGQSAGGDLAGSYPGPEVAGLRGVPLSASGLSDGQVLAYDAGAGQWRPAEVSSGGGGVTDHGELRGLGDDDHPQYIREGERAEGDLEDRYPGPTVGGIQHHPVSRRDPADGQVLAWDEGAGEYVPTSSSPVAGSDHGTLAGLGDDDHLQYLLAEGVRDVTDGFAVSRETMGGDIPVEGGGTRLMWYPGKAAFRAGEVGGTHWDDANVGRHSVAFGEDTEASGDPSTAMGENTIASGDHSTAMGQETTASGGGSTAMGSNTEATANQATAMGEFTTASGNESTAMGRSTTASGQGSTAMGENTTASGDHSTAMGRETEASGDDATAMGRNTTASGSGATAMGRRAKAEHGGTFVWGDNTNSDFASTAADQFLIRAGGGMGIGTNDPLTQFHVADNVSGALRSDHVAYVHNESTSDEADALFIEVDILASNTTTGNSFIKFVASGTILGEIRANGSGGIEQTSASSDFAEMLPRRRPSETIEAGEVVGLYEGEVTKETAGAEQLMVVSDQAIVVGNDPGTEASAHYEKVAFVGQVPVKTHSPVERGDLLVASGQGDGTARGVAPSEYEPKADGPVVGQAWESSKGGTERVNALIGSAAEAAALRNVTERQQELMEEQQDRINEQSERLERKSEELEALRETTERFEAQNAEMAERLDRLEATVERLVGEHGNR